jgi:hypothetical protein
MVRILGLSTTANQNGEPVGSPFVTFATAFVADGRGWEGGAEERSERA